MWMCEPSGPNLRAGADDARIMNGYANVGELRQQEPEHRPPQQFPILRNHPQQQQQPHPKHNAKMAAVATPNSTTTTTYAKDWPSADKRISDAIAAQEATTGSAVVAPWSRLGGERIQNVDNDVFSKNDCTYWRIGAKEDEKESDKESEEEEEQEGYEVMETVSSCNLIPGSCNQSSHNHQHHKKTAYSFSSNSNSKHLLVLVFTLLVVILSSHAGSAFLLDGSQNSFAQFRKWYTGLNGTLELEFKSDQPNGLVLYTDDGGTYDFFELKLVEGVLRLRYNLGGGAQIIAVGRDLHDGHWHKVQVSGKELFGV